MALNASAEAVIADRRAKAWDLRVEGKSYREIGAALGVSQGTAFSDVTSVLAQVNAETKETAAQHKQVELDRLEAAAAVLIPIMRGTDKKLALDAIDRLTKVSRRKASLLGLDAPTRVTAEVSGIPLDELEALRQAAQANECLPKDQPPPSDSSEPNS